MSYHSIKLRPADIKFSLYIREKRGWRCEFCKKLCKVNGEWVAKLEASHYHSRSHENTRFDEENVRVLCFTCHKNLGGYTRNEQGEYDLWMKKLLGEKGYRNLKIRANTFKRKDDSLILLWLKTLTPSV